MADKDREPDTFFVRPKQDQLSYPQNESLNFPDGRIVKALPRELFEEAVRAANLKE